VSCWGAFDGTGGKLPGIDTTRQIVEESIDSVSDTQQFVKEMTVALGSREPSAAILLGDYYAYDKSLSDGFVAKDDAKAEHYYKLAGEMGMAQGYYKVAEMAAALRDYAKCLYFLDMAMNAPVSNPKLKTVIASEYAAVTMEYYSEQKGLLQKSATFLTNNTNQVATAEFLLANIYNKLGFEDSASFYLTKACTNPRADENLRDLCMNKKGITLSVNGKQEGEKREEISAGCPACK